MMFWTLILTNSTSFNICILMTELSIIFFITSEIGKCLWFSSTKRDISVNCFDIWDFYSVPSQTTSVYLYCYKVGTWVPSVITVANPVLCCILNRNLVIWIHLSICLSLSIVPFIFLLILVELIQPAAYLQSSSSKINFIAFFFQHYTLS